MASSRFKIESDRTAGSKKSEDALQTDTFEYGLQTESVPLSYPAMQFRMSKEPHAWKKRPRSPGLKWYKDYDSPDSFKNGRILVIDYVKQGTILPDINVDWSRDTSRASLQLDADDL